MQKNKLRTLLILSFLTLFGCNSALLDLQKDSEIRVDRINTKEADLVNLGDQNQQLSYEKNKLLTELGQKNTTLDELNTQLTKLKAANSQIRAATDAERKKRAKLSRNLDDYSKKINELNNDNNLGTEEKKKMIEELKQNIKAKVKKDSELFNN
jgi:chromosome segregation ATPase